MSVGLQCDCPLPPMDGLTMADKGHHRRAWAKERRDCPQYAEDQKHGGMCRFCADAHRIRAARLSAAGE